MLGRRLGNIVGAVGAFAPQFVNLRHGVRVDGRGLDERAWGLHETGRPLVVRRRLADLTPVLLAHLLLQLNAGRRGFFVFGGTTLFLFLFLFFFGTVIFESPATARRRCSIFVSAAVD